MIESLKITDFSDLPLPYVGDIEFFKDKKEIVFDKNINIIVGANGSGKSTLIKLLALYTLCPESTYSVQGATAKLDKRFDDMMSSEGGVFDGAEVKADYTKKTFHLIGADDIHDELIENMVQLKKKVSKAMSSTGESGIYSINSLWDEMFGMKDYSFPPCNMEWQYPLRQYYKRNSIGHDNIFTVLMDEPDKGLDIENVMQLHGIINAKREDTQLIISLHNPALIYKLYMQHDFKFIETSKGYLFKIVKFFE